MLFRGGVDANITAQLIKARVVTGRCEEAAAALHKSARGLLRFVHEYLSPRLC